LRSKSREHLRREKSGFEVLSDGRLEAIDAQVEDWGAARRAGTGTLFERLELCLEKLPERLRQAVGAFYFGDQPGEAAAASLSVPAAALRKRLHAATGGDPGGSDRADEAA